MNNEQYRILVIFRWGSGGLGGGGAAKLHAAAAALEEEGLVLDVDGTRVILSRKEAGKRSQLWRMTPSGMIQHEGSSPPQDPKKQVRSPQTFLSFHIFTHTFPEQQPKHNCQGQAGRKARLRLGPLMGFLSCLQGPSISPHRLLPEVQR